MKKTIRVILIIFAIGIMGYSGYKLWDIYREYAVGEKLYDDYANRFIIDRAEAAELNEEDEKKSQISIDFDALFAENKDIVGWIYSEDTPINYPIVQSDDNDYYLRRMLDGSYNIAGSIFMDYRNSSDLTDSNTIIYGHNMKNDTMFGTLEKYGNQEYYDEHPIIYYMAPEKTYEIQLVTGYVTDAWSNTYKIPQTIKEQNELIKEMISKSSFDGDYSFGEGDNLITLSTCAYDFNDARYVVIGRLVEM